MTYVKDVLTYLGIIGSFGFVLWVLAKGVLI